MPIRSPVNGPGPMPHGDTGEVGHCDARLGERVADQRADDLGVAHGVADGEFGEDPAVTVDHGDGGPGGGVDGEKHAIQPTRSSAPPFRRRCVMPRCRGAVMRIAPGFVAALGVASSSRAGSGTGRPVDLDVEPVGGDGVDEPASPLDDDDAAGEVDVEVVELDRLAEPVGVDVHERRAADEARVGAREHEGGAGHRAADAEPLADPAGERRLARAERAR